MAYSTITIIYNPVSTGDSKSNAEDFMHSLKQHGAKQVVLQPTDHPRHAEELAYELAKGSEKPLIISSSGDGGYNEVINGALRAQAEGAAPTTGLLPSGNANDHYKQLHNEDIVEHIINGARQHIDVLKLTTKTKDKTWERYAHSYIGFGVTSEIGMELNKAELNAANEIIISLKAFLKSRPFEIVKGGKHQEFQSIVISNIAKMSKVLGLAKDSSVDDGLFEVFALPPNKAFVVGVLVKSATVGLRYSEQTDHYDFKTLASQPVQCDGEVFTIKARSNVSVGIESKLLACVV